MGARAEWRRGWPVVLGVALGGGTGGALFFYISSLFVGGLSAEFGWSRGEIATVYAVAGLGALASPLIGWLVDRYGFKAVATAATLGLVTLYLVYATYRGPLSLFVAISAFYGLFAVGTGSLVYTRPVNAWFDASRGLALGISTLGVSVFAIIAPPLLQSLMAEHGWRSGYMALAALAAGVGLPAMLFLVRPQPREPVVRQDLPATPTAPTTGVDVRTAIRTPWFWLLALALTMINAAGTGLLSQLSPMLQERGLSAATAAQALSLYAAGLIFGRLGCGALLDRLPPARVAAAFTLAPAIGCALILFGGTPGIAFAAALFIGMQQGAETDVLAWFISRIFGMRCYGAVFGAILGIGYTGTILGILLMGWSHVWTGAYDLAVSAAAAAFAVGALAFLMIGRPRAMAA